MVRVPSDIAWLAVAATLVTAAISNFTKVSSIWLCAAAVTPGLFGFM